MPGNFGKTILSGISGNRKAGKRGGEVKDMRTALSVTGFIATAWTILFSPGAISFADNMPALPGFPPDAPVSVQKMGPESPPSPATAKKRQMIQGYSSAKKGNGNVSGKMRSLPRILPSKNGTDVSKEAPVLQKDDEFLREIMQKRKLIYMTRLDMELKKMSMIGSPDRNNMRPNPFPRPNFFPGFSPPRPQEKPVEKKEPRMKIVGSSGNRVILQWDGYTRRLRVGESWHHWVVVRKGEKLGIRKEEARSENPSAGSREDVSRKSSGGKHSLQTIGRASIGGPSGPGSDIHLVSTSHFYARVIFNGAERELATGSTVDGWEVESIGDGSIVLKNMASGKNKTIYSERSNPLVPGGPYSGMPQSPFPGVVPTEPQIPQPIQGQAQGY
jgi:hypothetical protein